MSHVWMTQITHAQKWHYIHNWTISPEVFLTEVYWASEWSGRKLLLCMSHVTYVNASHHKEDEKGNWYSQRRSWGEGWGSGHLMLSEGGQGGEVRRRFLFVGVSPPGSLARTRKTWDRFPTIGLYNKATHTQAHASNHIWQDHASVTYIEKTCHIKVSSEFYQTILKITFFFEWVMSCT